MPSGDYAQFLSTRLGEEHVALQPGALVTSSGEVIGEHSGYARYTVGQRRGLGGGRGRPLFVLGVRAASNEVIVGTHEELFSDTVTLRDLNWLQTPPHFGETVSVQLRHRSAAVAATITSIDDDVASLQLHEPQRAVTPGQSGACYRGVELIGGGRIC